MKFIVDDNIPYIEGALEPFGEVVYLPGAKTTAETVREADALITRTRTICNEKLLQDSTVKFIATATIGFDHIDTAYCDQADIKWTNAPGCNAKSVEQYIASALFTLAREKGFTLKEKTLGVVGVGNVGRFVAQFAKTIGMRVLLNDPPRARAEGDSNFVRLETILDEADLITLHTPLNMDGEDKTFHLADETFFAKAKRKPILINSCRGEVIKTDALISALQAGRISGAVIDCWENEPNLNHQLLALTDLATPHIAGYSKDGKANGTAMSIRAVSRFFNLGIDNWQCLNIELPEKTVVEIDGKGKTTQEIIAEAVLSTYQITEDDRNLRNAISTFEKQRGDYPVRREFPTYTVIIKNGSTEVHKTIKNLGFNLL